MKTEEIIKKLEEAVLKAKKTAEEEINIEDRKSFELGYLKSSIKFILDDLKEENNYD